MVRTAMSVLLLVALACGHHSQQPDDIVALAPVPTPVGAPMGPPTSGTISAQGGVVSTPDGALSISIPAGAVGSATELTITPITNTARGGAGGAFRLGPEGTTFAQPVTLTFRGLDEYPAGDDIGSLGVLYQDASRYWVPVAQATRNSGTNTISVETTHFSDWALAWVQGTPVAEGPIQLSQTVDLPFDARGAATVYVQDDSPAFTSYVFAGTLTVADRITIGGDTCVPDQISKSWANTAEIDKNKSIFRWGVGNVYWKLTCTATSGAVTTRLMPAVFDTMGINLGYCSGSYDPGQYAELDFLKGAYKSDCGSAGMSRAAWDLRGYQILVNPTSGLQTTEAGGTATFQISLNKPPLADVTVPLASSDATEGSVPASVTFTPANWNTPQTVTVTGVDDFVDDDDVAYVVVTGPATSTDAHYQGIDPENVQVTNLDDDTAGLALTPSSGLVTTEAGGTATFGLTLTSQPLADVVITLSSSDTTEGTVSPTSLTFTSASWNVPQTVTLTGVNDFVDDGDVTYSALATASSADPKYQALAGSASATNLNDDHAGYSLVPAAGLVTTEAGGTATFKLSLASEPYADVTIALTSSDTTEGTVLPASVTFSAADWNLAQTVTVTGVNDFVDDGDIAYTVQLVGTSADPGYGGRTGSVSLTNVDDDTAGFTSTPSSGLVTTEAGGTATFQLTLSSQPLADVVIGITSSDTTEGTVSPASVSFTSATWNVPQTITLAGVDDLVADGPIAYAIQMRGTSADPAYAGLAGSVGATNVDNDFAGITAGTPSGTVTSEAGTSVTFTLVLTSQPTADVTIPLSSSDTTEGTVSPASVTFTATSWNLPQTVTVTGVDDFVADGTQPYTIAIGPATSTDPGYAGKDPADLAFTNTDNDVVGLVATPSTGLITTEAGGTASFQLTLSSQPTADVVVGLTSSDTTEGTVSPGSVTFTSATWNAPQTITVTGVDDLVVDGPIAYAIQLSVTSTDAGYGGRTGSVSVTNQDDDTAGITVGAPSGTSTSESGTTVTFTLVLTSQPTADVTIPLSSSDTTEGTVSPASVTFTPATWNLPQTVTLTGVDDSVADGTQPYTIAIGAAASTDPIYAGIDPADLTFTNTDNDVVGLSAVPSTGLVTTEAGGTASFQLTLSSQPIADVVVALSSSDTTEGTVSPASVTFTPTTWNAAQTITVAGVDDLVADGAIAYAIQLSATSTDAAYGGRTGSVSVTNQDDDAAGITVGTPSGTSTSETGTSVTFTLVLTSQPTADVTIPLSSSDTTEGTVSPASVTFTPATWNQPQTVTVTGVNDPVADGTQPYTIAVGPATSTDPGYAGKDPADLAFTNTDDDVVGLVATPSTGLVTTEAGGTASFQLTLSSQPTADVVVALSSSDTTEGTVSPTSVTFTPASWSTPQTVTVIGVDDVTVDGAISYSVQLTATSTDVGYGGRTASVSVTNQDNDVAGLSATPSTGLVTTEAGGTASFQLTLSSQPTADVVVALSSSDTTEGTASSASVTFTPASWNLPQTITVTGVDDLVVDGPITYAIQLSATSADAGYGGRTASVSVTNQDNDTAGITVGTPSGTSTSEAGTSVTFTVVLTSQPTADVTIPLSSSDTTEGTVSPASVTFAPATWNQAQTVTVTGVDDLVADGPQTYTIQLGPATSTDPSYAGKDPADLAFTNTDNDAAGLVATPATGLVTTEAGGTATFQLTLSSEPTADVVVALSSSNTTEGTVSPASVTFTPTTWNVPQTIAVTGVDDPVADGAIQYAIQLSATSADAGYGGRTASVSATNTDNDVAGLVATPATGLVTTEAGGAATFQLTLSSQPTADVVVALSSSDTTEGTVSPASVTFTAATWNVSQTVTVTGVDDLVTDGAIAYAIQLSAASADPGYGGRTGTVSVTNQDNDLAGITVGTPSGTSTSETGTSVTFTLVLTSQPTADVTIPVSSSDTSEGIVSPASLVFTTTSWNVAQTVTVTGVNDLVADGTQTYTILIGPATSADTSYAGKDPADLTFTNTDNDLAGLVATPATGLVTTEAGGTATFQLTLSSQPTADVVVALSSTDTTEGTVSPASVTFTTTTWNVGQTVTVTGVDDLVADGSIPYAIQLSAASADVGYGGRTATVSVTNQDNDLAEITVGTPSGTFTSETGTSVTFTLVLTSQPTADVTIPISSSNTAEGVVSTSGLVFTPADWNVAQTVTVTGADDFVADGTQPYTITIGPSTSADPSYAAIDPADLAFTNTDNDLAGITVGTPSGTFTSETGTSVTFTLVLTSQPTADVTIPVSSSDTTEGIVSPASLVFTATSWNVAQTVTVTGVNDLVVDGDQVYTVVIGPSSSLDPGYQGIDPPDILLTNVDDGGVL